MERSEAWLGRRSGALGSKQGAERVKENERVRVRECVRVCSEIQHSGREIVVVMMPRTNRKGAARDCAEAAWEMV